MKQANWENIYREIALLSDTERNNLYNRMRNDFYQDSEVVAYTTNNEALTIEKYKKRVNAGIMQCIKRESISLEKLSKELGYDYADL